MYSFDSIIDIYKQELDFGFKSRTQAYQFDFSNEPAWVV